MTADLALAPGERLASYNATLTWNATKAAFVDTLPGGFAGAQVNIANVGTGELRFTGADPAGAAGTPTLVNDVPAAESSSRETLIWAAHSYFDALEGDSGAIGAFADDCVRHENGYQTVANKTPGRAAPGPNIPSTDTPQGRMFAQLSMIGDYWDIWRQSTFFAVLGGMALVMAVVLVVLLRPLKKAMPGV